MLILLLLTTYSSIKLSEAKTAMLAIPPCQSIQNLPLDNLSKVSVSLKFFLTTSFPVRVRPDFRLAVDGWPKTMIFW